MKETTMNYWQIAQFFLSDTGVHEVEVNLTSAKLKCTVLGLKLENLVNTFDLFLAKCNKTMAFTQ